MKRIAKLLTLSVLILNHTEVFALSTNCLTRYSSVKVKNDPTAEVFRMEADDLATKFIGLVSSVDMSPLTQESLLKAHLKLERSISTSEIEDIAKDLKSQDPQEKNFGKKVDFVNDELEKLNKMLSEFSKGEVPWQKRINKQKYLDEKKQSILASFNGIKIILNILKSSNFNSTLKVLNDRYYYFGEQEKILEKNLSFVDNFTISMAEKLHQYPHLASKLSTSLNILSTSRIMLDSNIRLIQSVKSLIADKLRNIAIVKSLVENEQEFSYLTILIQNGVYFSNIEEKLNEISKSQKGLTKTRNLPIVGSDYNNLPITSTSHSDFNAVSSSRKTDLGIFSSPSQPSEYGPKYTTERSKSGFNDRESKDTRLEFEQSNNFFGENALEKELDQFLTANKIWIPEQKLKQLITTEYQLAAFKLISKTLSGTAIDLDYIFKTIGSFKSQYSYDALEALFTLNKSKVWWIESYYTNFLIKYQVSIFKIVNEVIAPMKSKEEFENFSQFIRVYSDFLDVSSRHSSSILFNSLLEKDSVIIKTLQQLTLKNHDENLSFEEFSNKIMSLKKSFLKTSNQLLKLDSYQNKPILKFMMIDKDTRKLTIEELETKLKIEFDTILDLLLNIKRNSTYLSEDMHKLMNNFFDSSLKESIWTRFGDSSKYIIEAIYKEIVFYKLSNFEINTRDDFKRFSDVVKFLFADRFFDHPEIKLTGLFEDQIWKIISQKVSIFHDQVLKSKYIDIENELLNSNSNYPDSIKEILFNKANELFEKEISMLDSEGRRKFIANYKRFTKGFFGSSFELNYDAKNKKVLSKYSN